MPELLAWLHRAGHRHVRGCAGRRCGRRGVLTRRPLGAGGLSALACLTDGDSTVTEGVLASPHGQLACENLQGPLQGADTPQLPVSSQKGEKGEFSALAARGCRCQASGTPIAATGTSPFYTCL